MLKKVAIITNGGDAPGLNTVIRAIVKTAETHGIECYGYIEGYRGLLTNNYVKLDSKTNASGLLHRGGTIIGTSNSTNVFNLKCEENGQIVYKDMSQQCIDNIKEAGFDCIFTLGGDGTQKSGRDFSLRGVNVIGVPKTIDNDVACTEITFVYNTAVSVATEAIDRLHTTAETHNRIICLEVMGRFAGWIALESAIAGGADVALIPEIPYDISKVIAAIDERKKMGKNFGIVVVGEGAKPIGGELSVAAMRDGGTGVINTQLGGAAEIVAKEIRNITGISTRTTVLGYMQRGGTPTSFDRVLSTKYGAKAMELAMNGIFNVLTVIKNGKLDYVPLEDVVGNNKEIGAVQGGTAESNTRVVSMNDDLVKTARDIGICLGD